MYQLEGLIKGPAVFLQHVSNEYGGASRNSSSTMHQHIPSTPPRSLNPLIGWPKGISGVLALAVIEVELQMHDFLGVGEVEIDA